MEPIIPSIYFELFRIVYLFETIGIVLILNLCLCKLIREFSKKYIKIYTGHKMLLHDITGIKLVENFVQR